MSRLVSSASSGFCSTIFWAIKMIWYQKNFAVWIWFVDLITCAVMASPEEMVNQEPLHSCFLPKRVSDGRISSGTRTNGSQLQVLHSPFAVLCCFQFITNSFFNLWFIKDKNSKIKELVKTDKRNHFMSKPFVSLFAISQQWLQSDCIFDRQEQVSWRGSFPVLWLCSGRATLHGQLFSDQHGTSCSGPRKGPAQGQRSGNKRAIEYRIENTFQHKRKIIRIVTSVNIKSRVKITLRVGCSNDFKSAIFHWFCFVFSLLHVGTETNDDIMALWVW